jgi:hypothetical protein
VRRHEIAQDHVRTTVRTIGVGLRSVRPRTVNRATNRLRAVVVAATASHAEVKHGTLGRTLHRVVKLKRSASVAPGSATAHNVAMTVPIAINARVTEHRQAIMAARKISAVIDGMVVGSRPPNAVAMNRASA